MKLRLLAVAALAAVLPACSTATGAAPIPDCALRNGSSVLLMAQAVPEAGLVPCVDRLGTDWAIGAVEVERGRASFVVESDELGGEFLEVRLEPPCPARASEATQIVAGGTMRASQVVQVSRPRQETIAVIPEGSSHVVAATGLARDMSRVGVDAELVPVGPSLETRLDSALAAGRSAVLVDDLSRTEDIVVLVEVGSRERTRTSSSELLDALDGLDREAAEHSYQGFWQHRFAGGCVTYDFDARGPASMTLEEHVPEAISFVARATLDRFTRANVGLRLDP